MSKRTGWQFINAIMSISDKGIPLDKNGLECTYRGFNNILVSIAGDKQVVYLRDVIKITDKPVGSDRSYGELYDARINSYTIPAQLPNPTTTPEVTVKLGDKVVAIAKYRGYKNQECPTEIFDFSLETNSKTITWHDNKEYTIPVKSTFIGGNQKFSAEIESISPWNQQNQNGMIVSIDPNYNYFKIKANSNYLGRDGIESNQTIKVKLVQEGSDKIIYFSLIRQVRKKITKVSIVLDNNDVAITYPNFVYIQIFEPKRLIEDSEFSPNSFPKDYPFGSRKQFTSTLMFSANDRYAYLEKTFAAMNLPNCYEGDHIPISLSPFLGSEGATVGVFITHMGMYLPPYYADISKTIVAEGQWPIEWSMDPIPPGAGIFFPYNNKIVKETNNYMEKMYLRQGFNRDGSWFTDNLMCLLQVFNTQSGPGENLKDNAAMLSYRLVN